MKKYIFAIAAVMGLMAGNANATGGVFTGVPMGPSQSLATADYGGVDRSTVSLSSSNVLCFTGVGSVVGVVVSSNISSSDYLVFRDTGSLQSGAVSAASGGTGDYLTTDEFARVYLSTTGSYASDTRYGTTYSFPKPIRVYKGLAVRCIVNTINTITILWNGLDRK